MGGGGGEAPSISARGGATAFRQGGQDIQMKRRFPSPMIWDELDELNLGLLLLLSPGALSTGEQEPQSNVKSLILAVVLFEYLYLKCLYICY